MNILLIEDEKDLAETGKVQLEMLGHVVFTAFDLAEARALIEDKTRQMHMVIADHRLPDGLGIDFVIELRKELPSAACAIVSGCLSDEDVDRLDANEIVYFRKPLLYRKVVDQVQKDFLLKKPVAQVEEASAVEPVDVVEELPKVEREPEAPVQKKVGLWARIFGKEK